MKTLKNSVIPFLFSCLAAILVGCGGSDGTGDENGGDRPSSVGTAESDSHEPGLRAPEHTRTTFGSPTDYVTHGTAQGDGVAGGGGRGDGVPPQRFQ